MLCVSERWQCACVKLFVPTHGALILDLFVLSSLLLELVLQRQCALRTGLRAEQVMAVSGCRARPASSSYKLKTATDLSQLKN